MLQIDLDETNGIALLRPDGALSEDDFTSVARIIDAYVEKSGKLKGIIIQVETFPGWDSFAGFTAHLKFVKEHHKEVSFVALVTDSVLGDFAEHIVSHFVSAEVKHFAYDAVDDAREWINIGSQKA
jgi:hypothetical protein